MLRLSFDSSGQCIVSAKISGARMDTFEFAIDTGANYVHLDDKKCKELRLTPFGAVPLRCVHGVVESLPRYKGRVQIDGVPYAENDRSIVGFVIKKKHCDDKAEITPEERARQPSLKGLLGREVLASLKFTMDKKKSEAYLEPSI